MKSCLIDKREIGKLSSAISRGDLNFYRFYNLDFNPEEHQFQKYMLNYQEGDHTSKILNKSYYDIEVAIEQDIFPDPEKAAYPVNAIAIYNNIKNEAVVFALPYKGQHMEVEREVKDIYFSLVKENPIYDIPDINIRVQTYTQEIDLLKDFFIYARQVNSLFLIGFNSSLFDDPYVVKRGINLMGEGIYKYISEFGEIKKFGERSFEWPDYIKVDILNLYKPVDQGGAGLGKSLPNYKLNTVSKKELGISKLDMDDMILTYRNDLPKFLAYNLMDTLLTFKLDESLQFLELNWMLAKYNNAPMSSTIRGRSIMYRFRNNLIYTKRNKLVRNKLFGREVFYPMEQTDE
jgi:DNA polymerase elongation subunit (family B)